MATTEDLPVSSLPASTTVKKCAVEAISGAKDVFKTFKGKVSESAHTSKDHLHSAKQSIEDLSGRKASEKRQSNQPNLTERNSGEISSTGSTELQAVREFKSKEESIAFPLSILVWCSTLCSREIPTPEARPEDLQEETAGSLIVQETKPLMTEDVDCQVIITPNEFVEEVSSAPAQLKSQVSTPKEFDEAASSALNAQVNTVEDSIGKAFKSETSSTIIKETVGETFKYKFSIVSEMVGDAESALKSNTEFISNSVDEGTRSVKSKMEDVHVGDIVGEAQTAFKSKFESVGDSLDESTRAFKSKFDSLGDFKPKLFS